MSGTGVPDLEHAANDAPRFRQHIALGVERGAFLGHHFAELRTDADLITAGADWADVEGARGQRGGGVVDAGRIDCRPAEREPQLGKVRGGIGLAAGGFEQHGGGDVTMQILQRSFRIHIECASVRRRRSDVGLNGCGKARLADLSENRGAEIGIVQRRGAERDEGIGYGRMSAADPLRENAKRAARPLELRQRGPLALEHG